MGQYWNDAPLPETKTKLVQKYPKKLNFLALPTKKTLFSK